MTSFGLARPLGEAAHTSHNATATRLAKAHGQTPASNPTVMWVSSNVLKICMQNKHCQLQVVNTAQRDPPGGHIFLHASTLDYFVHESEPSSVDF